MVLGLGFIWIRGFRVQGLGFGVLCMFSVWGLCLVF
jgi:hypothetical protein